MIALGVLAAAILLCGLVVVLGVPGAEALVALLPESQQQSQPLLETLFSLAVFGSLLLFALAGAALTRVDPLWPGRAPAKAVPAGLAAGAFGIAFAAGAAALHGTLSQTGVAPSGAAVLLWGAAVVLFQSASEEVYFRGWLQPVLARSWGEGAAVVVAALAFAALHVMGGARSPVTLVNLFLGGLLFGSLAARGGGVAAAIAAHFAWNVSEQILLGLDPNPGLGSFGALVDLDLGGAPAWGGSGEGLNGSLAMTAALVVLIVRCSASIAAGHAPGKTAARGGVHPRRFMRSCRFEMFLGGRTSMASSTDGNRLVFKPSPLKSPPSAEAPAALASPATGHGVRDDVTLFMPGTLDGATMPSLASASPADTSPAEAPPAPLRKTGLGGPVLLLLLAAAVILVIALLGLPS